jgi:hypothetical protein
MTRLEQMRGYTVRSCVQTGDLYTRILPIWTADIANKYDALGFVFQDDPIFHHCFVKNILPQLMPSTYLHWQIVLCCILCIDDDIIFYSASAHAIFGQYLIESSDCTNPPSICITFASDKSLLHCSDPNIESAPIQLH